MSLRTRSIDTVLFDLDDTLLDDSRAYKAPRDASRKKSPPSAASTTNGSSVTYVAQANGFWKKLSAEHLTLPIHDARAQLWSDALVAAGVPVDVALAERCGEHYTRYRADGLDALPRRARADPRAARPRLQARDRHQRLCRDAPREGRSCWGCGPTSTRCFWPTRWGWSSPIRRSSGSPAVRWAASRCAPRWSATATTATSSAPASVGLFTVLIDIHAIPLPDGAHPPDAVVDSIAGVLDVLPFGGRQGPRPGAQKAQVEP